MAATPPMSFTLLAGWQTGAGQHGAECTLAASSMLGSRDVAVAVDDDVDRIGVGSEHRGQVGVLGEDDATGTRILLQILLHRLLRLVYVHREHHQSLIAEFLVQVVHQRLLAPAVRAPGGPELQQNNLALYRVVGELFTSGGFGVEARGRLTATGEGGGGQCENQGEQKSTVAHGGPDRKSVV